MAYCQSAAEIVLRALSLEQFSPVEACELYARAIGVLLQGVKCDDDSKRKKAVKAKVLQYMMRLERLLKVSRESVMTSQDLDEKNSSLEQTPAGDSMQERSVAVVEGDAQVGDTQVYNESRERRNSSQVDMSSSDTSDPLSSLNCEQSDMYSITSEVESAEGSSLRDEEELRQVIPDALAPTDALASINRIVSEMRGDPEMWELEEELKRILKEAT